MLDGVSNTYEGTQHSPTPLETTNTRVTATRTTQLDATLRSIDEITNMDIEMQVRCQPMFLILGLHI